MNSIQETRQELGPSFQHLSDAEISRIDEQLWLLAEIMVEAAMQEACALQQKANPCYDAETTQKVGADASLLSSESGIAEPFV